MQGYKVGIYSSVAHQISDLIKRNKVRIYGPLKHPSELKTSANIYCFHFRLHLKVNNIKGSHRVADHFNGSMQNPF